MRKIFSILAVLALAFFLNCGGALDKDKASQIIKDFAADLKSGKTKQATDYTAACTKHGVKVEDFQKYLEKNKDAQEELQKAVTGLMPSTPAVQGSKPATVTQPATPGGQPATGTQTTPTGSQPATGTQPGATTPVTQPGTTTPGAPGTFDAGQFGKELTTAMMKLPPDKIGEFSTKLADLSTKAAANPTLQTYQTLYTGLVDELKKSGADVSKLETMLKAPAGN